MITRSGRTVRVGLVADTHVGEFLDELPDWVPHVLEGCDLILHAGDLSHAWVLDRLALVAPVKAVRGDHDVDCGHLPEALVVSVAGWRIGLVHGGLGRPWDTRTVVRQAALGAYDWHARLHRRLHRRLGAVDAVVYGHWHIPLAERVGGTLFVSPGAVCPWGSLEGGRPPRPGAAGVADVVVRRFRERLDPEAMEPTVAIMEVGSSGLRPRHLRMRPPGGDG
ncbi:MAG: metallophosphoesterase family protein [Thermoleophilia bacterium]|nr:metallophosphoesterase family protein [Thermoleophilia bacterium]